ncbi:hypothetical protein BDZ91DRAFT_400401 [Kalaharituber pfeilii]|nr:hypothetical protein BDZ91DRAFT_400401 [Kalaharituber pfeilii]
MVFNDILTTDDRPAPCIRKSSHHSGNQAALFLESLYSILCAPSSSPPFSKAPSPSPTSCVLLNKRTALTDLLANILRAIIEPQSSRSFEGRSKTAIEQLLVLVPVVYCARAAVYAELGYFDLAASDAYRAVLGVERAREWNEEVDEEGESVNESGESALDEDGNLEEELMELCSALESALGLEIAGGLRRKKRKKKEDYGEKRRSLVIQIIVEEIDLASLYLLSKSLIQTGCLSHAQNYLRIAETKFPQKADDWSALITLLHQKQQEYQEERRNGTARTDDQPSAETRETHNGERPAEKLRLRIRGVSRREVYPWNHYEPDRFSPDMLYKINQYMAQCCIGTGERGPWCEVRCVDLPLLRADGERSSRTVKQLGVFALRDIPAGLPALGPDESSHPYLSEPTNLIAWTSGSGSGNRGSRCEFCTAPLNGKKDTFVGCDKCEENYILTAFCVECKQKAMDLYHPAVCGQDWEWLHREAVKGAGEDFDESADLEQIYDDSAVYGLLLQKAWAMAIVQGIHPLEIPEVVYLYGAGNRRTRYLHLDSRVQDWSGERGANEGEGGDQEEDFVPFDFHQNVVVPHLILEGLGIDIVPYPPIRQGPTDLDYEDCSSVIQPLRDPVLALTHFDTGTSTLTLLNKFKGVASLTRHVDNSVYPAVETLIPAIHPLYSLSNHSCDPNVHWTVNLKGNMCFRALSAAHKFWYKGKKWEGNDTWHGGIREGEQIRNCYVDPGLGVVERRNRIWGIMGGACVCDRCVGEDGERDG